MASAYAPTREMTMSYDAWKLRSPDDDRELREGRLWRDEDEQEEEMPQGLHMIRMGDEDREKYQTEIEWLRRSNTWLAERLRDAVNTCYGGTDHAEVNQRQHNPNAPVGTLGR